MSRRLLLKACVLLAVSSRAGSQYIDFVENLNSFLQPFITNPRNELAKRPDTKHRQTNKQKYQDAIFFEDDLMKPKDTPRNLDPFNIYPTTTKPRRKSTKTSTTSHQNNNVYTTLRPDNNKPKKVNSNKIINNNRNVNHETIRSISSNNNEPYNNNVDNREINNNARRIDNYNGYNDNQYGYNNYNLNSETTSNRATNNNYGYPENNDNINYNSNRQTTQRTTTVDYYNNVRQTTRKTTTEYYNNARQTTPKTTTVDYYNNARQTTRKTTTVDYYNNARQTAHNDRQPTNNYDNERATRRPSNNRGVYGTHTAGHNPLLHRPGVKPAAVDENKPPITNRPVTSTPAYDPPSDTAFRPVNTRPPYETERPRPANRPETRPVNTRPPIETERPFSSGVVRPATSGVVRPPTSGVVRLVPGTTVVNEAAEPRIELGPDEDEMSDSEKRRLYNICEQKCDEYKAARVKKVVALPLAPHHRGVAVNVTSCPPTNVPLIIGGAVARIQQFPHMALLGWTNIQNGGYSWKCGGSLVSEQYVLTAGHCTYQDKDYNVLSGPPNAVQLGSAIFNDRSATVVQISLVVRHPKYKLRRSYYDVALIKMVTTVSFSDTISPACLGVPPPVGDPVIATGWGKTEFGGESSIELRSVSIPIWDMSDCREIWGTSLKLPNGPMPDNQICAGERKGAKDTCQGDSGGPAQVQDGCAWRLVAVTSVGRSCGAPETPALYARIPRAFVASQIYTNVKPGRDGNDQYGNDGINVNNNKENQNNNWGVGNNNRGAQNSNTGIGNNNSGTGNSNRGTGINNSGNDPFGNHDVANVRPIPNNNGQNYDNSGRVQYNNNGQYYSDSQGSGNNNRGVANNNNGNNFGSNQQNTRDNNDWSINTDITNNNRNNNQNNANNQYDNNQSNRNVYGQIGFGNNGQIYKTTSTTTGYNNQNNYGQNNYNNANNYGQNGYNNEQIQSGRYTETPSDVRNYETPSYGYNDNIRTENTYNNGFNMNYQAAYRPWGNK